MRDILTTGEDLDDVRYMLIREDVVIHGFAEEFLTAGIDEANTCICLMLGEYEDIHCDTCPVEEVRREGDDTLDIVRVHEVFTDLLLSTTPIEDTREADHGSPPTR